MHDTTITSKTLLPISLVVTLIGGVVWLSAMASTASQNKAAIQEIKEDERNTQKKLDNIIERLSRIEGVISGKR